MTLKSACDIAEACGLNTIGEAVLNIEFNAFQLFPYGKIEKELNELYTEAKSYPNETPISSILHQI